MAWTMTEGYGMPIGSSFAHGSPKETDFSVGLFRPHFMLVSEKSHMKAHKNQWLLNQLPPPNIP
jgi:hypothetical protein